MPTGPFKSHRLLLCEGIEDAAFLRELIQTRGLGNFDVRPVEDVCGVSGITGFAQALSVAVTITGFSRVSRIGLVADSDQLPGNTFTLLQNQITAANTDPNVNHRFTVPLAAGALGGGFPRIMILLLPTSAARGALDTLLWQAINAIPAHNAAATCAAAACTCAGIDAGAAVWPQAKLDKARVRIAIALLNLPNPAVPLGKLWQHYPALVPAANAVFNNVAGLLATL